MNLFRGRSPETTWQRVFGGQVIGQALVAACRTVEGRPPHSLHAYFLLPGDPKVPIVYEVDRMRDGKSFSTRRVIAIQHGHPIFTMAASFHADEEGFEHQAKMPDVPGPDAAAERSRSQTELHADDARSGAPLLRARAADRTAAGGIRALSREEIRRCALQCLDPRHRPAAGRSRDPSLRAGLCQRHDPARLRAWCRMAIRCSRRRSWRRASTTRCGFTGRSAPTNGCSMRRTAPTCGGGRGFSRGLIFTQDGTTDRFGGAGRPHPLAPDDGTDCPQPERARRESEHFSADNLIRLPAVSGSARPPLAGLRETRRNVKDWSTAYCAASVRGTKLEERRQRRRDAGPEPARFAGLRYRLTGDNRESRS